MAVRMVVHLYRVNLAKELKEQAAPLIAATLPSPVSSNCPIPRDAVALYLGNTVSVVTEFPHVIFRVHGEDVLALDPDASGLLISFTTFDDGCNVVGRLNRTVFTAINSASHVERPSASNLAVFDDRDTKVLMCSSSIRRQSRYWESCGFRATIRLSSPKSIWELGVQSPRQSVGPGRMRILGPDSAFPATTSFFAECALAAPRR
jgi:hypothetical protein